MFCVAVSVLDYSTVARQQSFALRTLNGLPFYLPSRRQSPASAESDHTLVSMTAACRRMVRFSTPLEKKPSSSPGSPSRSR